MQGQERAAVASGEGGDWLSDAHLSASKLGGVASNEVVHHLLWSQL